MLETEIFGKFVLVFRLMFLWLAVKLYQEFNFEKSCLSLFVCSLRLPGELSMYMWCATYINDFI